MDRFLEKEEKAMLLKLLEVNNNCFYNIPIMKTAFRKASKKWHPDKGGNLPTMTLLNSLWQKYQEAVVELRNTEVFSDAYGTPFFRKKYAEWAKSNLRSNERSQPATDIYTDESSSDEEPTQAYAAPEDSGPSTSSYRDSGYNSYSFSTPRETSTSFSSSASSSSTQEDASSAFSESAQSDSFSEARRSGPSEDGTPEKGRRHGETMDGSYNSSQNSFASTPPKSKASMSDSPTDLPSDFNEFISHAVFSNKTVNAFIIFSTFDKVSLLYEKIDKLKIEFKSLHKWNQPGTGFLLILTSGKHRLSAVKNYCQAFCTVSFLVCKILLKPLECYRKLCSPPFCEVKANKILLSTDFDENREETCNWNKVAEFAVEADLDDALLILAHYLDFAVTPNTCTKCINIKVKAHEHHIKHHTNALLFIKAKNQRSICNQAADIVNAKRRLALAESTRHEIITSCFIKQLEALKKLDEMQIIIYMGGVAWYACLFEEFDVQLFNILKMLTENVPKQRNILFKGPVNTGKTTLAAALMDLVGGKSLNINCPADKLNFELGCAIDRFAVVFEDVKGPRALNKNLQTGQGISNLDNMRDYLDGAVPVNLERKHVNKRSQIFPPCIVTMNEYHLPETLWVRFHKKLEFTCKPNLQSALEKTPELLSQRILQRGLTLFMLLLWYFPMNSFSVTIREEVKTWKKIIENTVNYDMFCKMLENVEVGESPLHTIIQVEEEECL
uniref:Large T antigen n=1 Tax=Eptesicus serotinus polyomavirus TaxID=3139987 RepID=A0AAU6S4Z6_9POLY